MVDAQSTILHSTSMSEPLKIRLRENGPIVVEGPFTLTDHLGNLIPLPTHKPVVALCRCGFSQAKPFCDGAHKTCGFDGDSPRVAPESSPSTPNT
ncbi:MAG: CDGSH iron-sulfur domain-containing protein [Pirellulales bacterium]